MKGLEYKVIDKLQLLVMMFKIIRHTRYMRYHSTTKELFNADPLTLF